MNIKRLSFRSVAALGAATLLTLAGCGGDDTTDAEPAPAATTAPAPADEPAAEPAGEPAGDNTITIADFAFSGGAEVAVGTTVLISNTDGTSHTWTADDGSFDSGTIAGGESFEFTVAEAGEFTYHCDIHPSMTGEVTVTA